MSADAGHGQLRLLLGMRWQMLREPKQRRRVAIAFALLAVPLPYKDPVLAAGWTALLAYPRLYGAWLLWAWLVREMWADRRAEAVSHVGVIGG